MTLAFMNIGTQEMILIVIVILLLFGGKKLPELARGLGRGIRDFKDASEGIKREISDQINNFEKDLDVTMDDKPKSDTPKSDSGSVTDNNAGVTEGTVESPENEKKFPQFSAPENTYQHNPGGHPADDGDYYKYGYNDHFATEENINQSDDRITDQGAEATPAEKSSDSGSSSKQA